MLSKKCIGAGRYVILLMTNLQDVLTSWSFWFMITSVNILICLFTASKVKDENVAKIWTLSAQDIDDDEIVSTIDLSHSTVMDITLHLS